MGSDRRKTGRILSTNDSKKNIRSSSTKGAIDLEPLVYY